MPDPEEDAGREEGAERRSRLGAIAGAVAVAVAGVLALLGLRRRSRESPEAATLRYEAERNHWLRRIGHEPNDVAVGAVIALGVLFVLLAIGFHLALWGVFTTFLRTSPGTNLPNQPMNAPIQGNGPTPTPLPVSQRVDMMPNDWDSIKAQQEAWLNSYGWVDRQNNVVHIPIEQAIDKVLQQGLPTRSGR